jgi:hypothetical protein
MQGILHGGEEVRKLVIEARKLYEHQEFQFTGDYGDSGFIEEYTCLFSQECPDLIRASEAILLLAWWRLAAAMLGFPYRFRNGPCLVVSATSGGWLARVMTRTPPRQAGL